MTNIILIYFIPSMSNLQSACEERKTFNLCREALCLKCLVELTGDQASRFADLQASRADKCLELQSGALFSRHTV